MKTKAFSAPKSLARSAAICAFTAAVAIIGTGTATAQSTSTMQHGQMQSGGSDGSMKLHMSMQESQKKMNDMQMSGDTDRDFVMMMRAHHLAGIDMAKIEVASGKDPEMIKEAKKIIASQQKDVEKFDSWLQKHPAK